MHDRQLEKETWSQLVGKEAGKVGVESSFHVLPLLFETRNAVLAARTYYYEHDWLCKLAEVDEVDRNPVAEQLSYLAAYMRAELLLLKLRVGQKGLAGVGTGSLHTHRATFSSWLQASLGQFHIDSDGNPALELDYWPSKGVQLAKIFQPDQHPSARFCGTGCLSSPLQS